MLGWILAFGLGASSLHAELSLPHFFDDHMVLQQGKAAPVWGWAEPQATVRISFAGSTVEGQADAEGEWRLELPSMESSATGRTLRVESGDFEVEIEDVLVGEVWFASGQSNMVMTLGRSTDAEAEIAKADYPKIRMFQGALTPAAEPQENIEGQWVICSPDTAGAYSAVAYYFAQRVHEELDVPVGILRAAWGGKPVETFTSREALETTELGGQLLEQMDVATANYVPEVAQKRYEAALAKWQPKVDAWRARMAGLSEKERANLPRSQARPPRKPVLAKPANVTEGQPGVLYNGMIHPFVGYAMQGAIWYQGEGNAKPGRASHYEEMFSLKIRDWRERWGDEFTYLYVQLANFRKPTAEPGVPDLWALLQDEQRKTLTVPNTGMAVINDAGEADDIHPRDKKTVGNRLALWALAKDYGKSLVYSGPLYRSYQVEGHMIRIGFDHIGGGLKSRDGHPLQRFEIAGADQVWHWADAVIDGKHVLVSSPKVEEPVAVRYAWASNPEGANLVNAAGLPASVFRTDDWPMPES